MVRRMKHLRLALFAGLALSVLSACLTDPNPIIADDTPTPAPTLAPTPAPTPSQTSEQGAPRSAMHREAPLHWIHDNAYAQDVQTNNLVSLTPCTSPEPDLHSFGIELGPDVLPHNADLRELRLRIAPCGARSVLPDNLPVMTVRLFDHAGVEKPTTSGARQDQSQNGAEYSMPHDMVWTPNGSYLVDRVQYRAMLFVEPEYGADSYGGFRVVSLSVRTINP